MLMALASYTILFNCLTLITCGIVILSRWRRTQVRSTFSWGAGFLSMAIAYLFEFFWSEGIIPATASVYFLKYVFLAAVLLLLILYGTLKAYWPEGHARLATTAVFVLAFFTDAVLAFKGQDYGLLTRIHTWIFVTMPLLVIAIFFFLQYRRSRSTHLAVIGTSWLIILAAQTIYSFLAGTAEKDLALAVILLIQGGMYLLLTLGFRALIRIDQVYWEEPASLTESPRHYQDLSRFMNETFGEGKGDAALQEACAKLSIPALDTSNPEQRTQLLERLMSDQFINVTSQSKMPVIRAKLMSLLHVRAREPRFGSRSDLFS